LLLCCLRAGTDGTRAPRLAQASEHDWDKVIEQAVWHGVAPLVYQRSKTIGLSATIPVQVLGRLRTIALHNALRNLLLCQELSEVLRTFQHDSIAVIVLKGAFLAEVVYADRALRPMLDVDLLVRKRDLSRAEARLLELGYSQPEPPSIEVNYATHHHSRPFTKPGGVKIELHRTIGHPSGSFNIDVDGLWNRARPATIANVGALALSPEDLLLHLCLHASFDHQFLFGLRSFCDISETIRHCWDDIDWEQIQHRACTWGVGKYVYLTLYLARELLEADVPEAALDSLKPAGFDLQVITWARVQIFSDAVPSLPPNLAQLWGSQQLREKIVLFLKSVFPSGEAMARMYHVPPDSNWIYLYYPLRWKDLLMQYSCPAWRMVHRHKTTVDLAKRENQKAALREWLRSAQ
jgi:hypothetical protein